MRRCLVTGGAGFIGSHLVAALLDSGASVRVLDDFSTGKKENLQPPAISAASGRLEVVEGDVRDAEKVQRAVTGVDVVFHEAAFVSVPESMGRPQECFAINSAGTAGLLEAARQAGVRRVVAASSAAVYGDSGSLPLREDGPVRPLSPYAASKQTVEILAALYTRALGLQVCALRYFNVYGPRQRPDTQYAAAVPIFIRRLQQGQAPTVFGDGSQTRDLVFVGDVVRANLIAAEHPAAAGEVFNICTGSAISILDLLHALYELMPGAPPPLFAERRQGDIHASVGDAAKAKAELGFAAESSLLEGLKKTVEWKQ